MKLAREIRNVADLDALETEWGVATHGGQADRVIRRVEDVPRLEDGGGQEISWVVDGLIADGSVHMITGEAGCGKSTLVSALGYAASMGETVLGRSTVLRNVLLLDAENPRAAVVERFRRLGIESHDKFAIWGQWCHDYPPMADDPVIKEWVARCHPGPLIVVDSMISWATGDENDASDMRRYLAQYRALASMGASVILLHHVGKSDGNYRGSTDIAASIDIGLKLVSNGDKGRLSDLTLKPWKQRFSISGTLAFSYADGSLVPKGEGPPEDATERLLGLLYKNPGVASTRFEDLAGDHGIGRNEARKFLKDAVLKGRVRVEQGTANAKLHYLVEGD